MRFAFFLLMSAVPALASAAQMPCHYTVSPDEVQKAINERTKAGGLLNDVEIRDLTQLKQSLMITNFFEERGGSKWGPGRPVRQVPTNGQPCAREKPGASDLYEMQITAETYKLRLACWCRKPPQINGTKGMLDQDN